MSDVVVGHEERAAGRLTRLRGAFAEVVETIAVMYRDEDWRYIHRADGTAYTSMAQLVADELAVAGAMARRYVQAARDFYLPLAAIAVDGTPITITSAQVRELGTDGLSDVVKTASPALATETDPHVSASIIAQALADVRATRDLDAEEGAAPDNDVRVLAAAVHTIAAASPGQITAALTDARVVERAWEVLDSARLVT